MKILQADVRDALGSLRTESVHCIITSPPYWGLREYGTEPQAWRGAAEPCQDHQWGSVRHPATKLGMDGNSNGVYGGGVTNPAKVNARTDERGDSCFCLTCGTWLGELGHEPTPELYVDHLVAVFREARRVLRNDGTLRLVIGDTYAGSNGGKGDRRVHKGLQADIYDFDKPQTHVLKRKDLVGIPWMVAFALRADGWWLRQDIIWSKTSCMTESVRDRCTRSHEYVFMLGKAERYYYDSDAILEPAAYDGRKDTQFKGSVKYANGFAPTEMAQTVHKRGHERWPKRMGRTERKLDGTGVGGDGSGLAGHSGYFDVDGTPRYRQLEDGAPARNKRDVWAVATQPLKLPHFASFPEKLVEPMLLAGTSERGVCPQCGAPWKRIVERTHMVSRLSHRYAGTDRDRTAVSGHMVSPPRSKTTGWRPACKCGAGEPVPATVLDPFSGSGTTGIVAVKRRRDYIGIELSPEYVAMSRERIPAACGGMFMELEV